MAVLPRMVIIPSSFAANSGPPDFGGPNQKGPSDLTSDEFRRERPGGAYWLTYGSEFRNHIFMFALERLGPDSGPSGKCDTACDVSAIISQSWSDEIRRGSFACRIWVKGGAVSSRQVRLNLGRTFSAND